jgi:hypothetical protein
MKLERNELTIMNWFEITETYPKQWLLVEAFALPTLPFTLGVAC